MDERMSNSTRPTPSLFTQLIRGAATRIAADPRVPEQDRADLAAVAEHVIWQQWRDIFGGERVRLRAPDVEPSARRARLNRIETAIANGEPIAAIARRERLTRQAVWSKMQKPRAEK